MERDFFKKLTQVSSDEPDENRNPVDYRDNGVLDSHLQYKSHVSQEVVTVVFLISVQIPRCSITFGVQCSIYLECPALFSWQAFFPYFCHSHSKECEGPFAQKTSRLEISPLLARVEPLLDPFPGRRFLHRNDDVELWTESEGT